MKIYNSILELTGNTPLVRLNKIEEKYNINNTLLVKLEMFNPSGSIKIRPAINMIEKALEKNIINKESVVIEATSGNMGIALSLVCSVLGMKFIAVMPSSMSIERQKLIKAYGGEIVLTKPFLGMEGAKQKALELKEKLNGFIPSQFENIDNPNSHYLTTAQEILNDTNDMVDIVVGGIGTGGTVSGIASRIKKAKDIKVIGVEPSSSPLITKGEKGSHKIQGIGANFIPETLNLKMVDDVIAITDEEAFFYAKELALLEGLFVGISSGAALAGALEYIEKNEVKDKTIVIILPDTGERYLSTGIVYE